MALATLLYDEDCEFCRWSVDKVLRWDRRGTLRAVAIQSPEAGQLLGEMDPVAWMRSAHLITPDGNVRSAGALVDPLFRMLPGGRPVAALARSMPRSTERFYRLVARNRTRIGGWLGVDACRVDPSDRGDRNGAAR